MAEKSRGGGFGWFIVGVLAGIALTLGTLAFVNLRGHRDRIDAASGADEAAQSAASEQAGQPPIIAPPVAAPPEVKPPHAVPAQTSHDADRAATQAADDAQMQDDAAASGNTSRARPPQ